MRRETRRQPFLFSKLGRRGVALVFLVGFSFLLLTPLSGSPEKTFKIWAFYSYTFSELHMVGLENENVTILTSPSIHFENVRILVNGMWIKLKRADAENLYMKIKYMETDIIVLNLLPLSHIIINGSHVDQGIPLIGGLMGLQTCQTVNAHMYPPLTWLVQMQNTYIVAEELRLSLLSENMRVHF